MADEGTDILSYKGNAALGYGGDGIPFPGSDGSELNSLSNLNAKIAQENFVWNQMQFKQKIDDRDKVMDLMSGAGEIDVPLLEKDQKVMDGNFDKLKQQLIETPNIKSDMTKYLEFQKTLRDNSNQRVYAKTRVTEAAKQRLDIASTLDPELKAKKQGHLDSEIKKGVDHIIEPYNNHLDWNPEHIQPTIKAEDYQTVSQNTFTDKKDGFIKTTTVKAPNLNKMIDVYDSSNILEGENKTFPNEIELYYGFATKSPTMMQDAVLQSANEKLNRLNIQRGLQPSDPHYLNPVAIKGADGKLHPSNAIDFSKGMYIAEKYVPVTETKRDEEAYKLNKEKSETSKNYAAAAKDNAEASSGIYKAQAAEHTANAAKALAEGDKEKANTENIQAHTATLKSTASQPVFEANQFFNAQTKNEDVNKFQPLAAFKVGGSANTPFDKLTGVQLAQSADIPTDWIAKEIPKKDLTAVQMLANPGWGDKDAKQQFVGWKTPARIVLFTSPDKDPKKSRLVGYDADGAVLKNVDINNGYENLIKYNTKYNGSKEMVDQINAGRQIIQDNTAPVARPFDATSQVRVQDGKKQILYNGAWETIVSKNEDGTVNTTP